jgi:2-methylcitrate dehydratase PrpD
MFVGEQLGHFVVSSEWGRLPEALRREARRSLLNVIGCALGVAFAPPVQAALDLASEYSGPRRATVIGRRERLDPLGACFVNAIAANLLDYDDTHLRTVIHPSAPVAPPVLALAEMHGCTGAALLHAFILGAEIECRLGNMVSPGHYARGWHITSTCGVFGAAVAAGKLLGLNAGQIWHALGIAASQSAGLVENLPSAAKNVSVGNAARNGLLAALLAQRGYEAAPAAIEGRLGWARATGDEPVLEEAVGELGLRWEMLRNTYKPYPCGIVMHAIIDACLDLRTQVPPERIAAVTVFGDALMLARGDRAVQNARDARVSIHHCASVALLLGRAGVAEYAEETVQRADIAALRARTRARLDPALPTGAARVVVETNHGQRVETRVLHARGSAERPLDDAEIEAKLRGLAGLGNTGCDAEAIIARVRELGSLPDSRPLIALLAGRSPA